MTGDKTTLLRRPKHQMFCSRNRILLTIGTVAGLWMLYCVLRLKHLSDERLSSRQEALALLRHLDLEMARQNKSRRTIVLWTPFFSQENYVLPLDRYSCPQSKCDFISNRSLIEEADAVMFHARDTKLHDLPKYRRPDQRWILLHHEAPPNTPDGLMQGLNGKINWTVTYRADSDVVLTPRYRAKLPRQGNASRYATRVSGKKRRLVAWFVSNCKTSSRREDFVQELRKTVTVDVFGSCGSYSCHPKMSHKCYQTIEREYFFYLSLENAVCKDYVTEKLFNVLDYNILPIMFGGVGEEAFLPPGSFINVFDFQSTADLGQYLIHLAKDGSAYDRYFRWKSEYEMEPYVHYACQICDKLHAPPTEKSWNNLPRWWYYDSNCKSWSPSPEE